MPTPVSDRLLKLCVNSLSVSSELFLSDTLFVNFPPCICSISRSFANPNPTLQHLGHLLCCSSSLCSMHENAPAFSWLHVFFDPILASTFLSKALSHCRARQQGTQQEVQSHFQMSGFQFPRSLLKVDCNLRSIMQRHQIPSTQHPRTDARAQSARQDQNTLPSSCPGASHYTHCSAYDWWRTQQCSSGSYESPRTGK